MPLLVGRLLLAADILRDEEGLRLGAAKLRLLPPREELRRLGLAW